MHITSPFLAILATASLATALPTSSSLPKNRPVKPQDIIAALAGTYTLVNTSRPEPHCLFISSTKPSSTLYGVPVPDAAYSSAPLGILTYSRSGHMSATITATEPQLRPDLTIPFQLGARWQAQYRVRWTFSGERGASGGPDEWTGVSWAVRRGERTDLGKD